MFSLASPIWIASSAYPVNEYGEFLASFSLSSLSRKVIARIAAASDFALLINEEMAGFGQYPHFHDEKFVEEIDITPYAKLGENKIRIIALSRDYPTASQVRSGKWLIYEFLQGEEVLSYSSIHTKSRKEPHYQSGKFPYITNQLGQGYRYSFEAKEEPFVPSKEIQASWRYSPRPVKRLLVGEKLPFAPLGPRLFDGGKELVGYLYFEIDSEITQTMVVSFGEHIVDGGVRRIIGDRDFSFQFTLVPGRNSFFGPLFRLGLRYFEISPIQGNVVSIGILPVSYPLTPVPYDFGEENNPIVEKSLYTMRCCMHDHYEDCPWREAAQYTMDSRIEIWITMLAFREFDFPKNALRTMARDFSSQGVLRLTTPSETQLSIPTYSLVYPLMVLEYVTISGDLDFAREALPKIQALLTHYRNQMVGGLLPHLGEWNFYEWADGLHFETEILAQKENKGQWDFILNAFFVLALKSTATLRALLGEEDDETEDLASRIAQACRDTFRDENGLYYSYYSNKGFHYSEFAAYLALYSGIVKEEEARDYLLKVLTFPDFVPMTLSNTIFKYDVWMRYGLASETLEDIHSLYGAMDRNGATTYYETIRGEKDFSGAGSLCHGWSAVPAYVFFRYFHNNVTKGGSHES